MTLKSSKRRFGSSASEAAPEFLNLFPQIASELLPIIMAIVLYAKRDTESPDITLEVPFEVRNSTEKGFGAFAPRDIQRGEVILTEQPLVVWPSELDSNGATELVDQMTEEARNLYMSLANAQSPESQLSPVLAIRATNGFTVQLPPIPKGSSSTLQQAQYCQTRSPSHASFIFPRIARINHDCLPNADHAIDWATLQMTVYATTDIKAGEEIAIEYTSGMIQKSRAERRAILKENFAFTCSCSLCGRSDAEVKKSDDRRKEIGRLVGVVGQAGAAGVARRGEVVDGLQGIKALLAEEGYKAMPEFDNDAVSSAFAVFSSMKQPPNA